MAKRMPKGPTTVLLPLIGVDYNSAGQAFSAWHNGDTFRISGLYREVEWRNSMHVNRDDFKYGDHIHIKYKYVGGYYTQMTRDRARQEHIT